MSKSEGLSYWYFRLNGFFTIPNFILHPQESGSARTDANVVGIRFPFRKEFPGDDVDDPVLGCSPTKPSLFIVEVKTKEIYLNDTWTSRPKENIEKLITNIGFLQEKKKIAEVSESLYDSGRFNGVGDYYWSFALVGNEEDIAGERVDGRYKSVPRIFWTHICKFIHQRMRTFSKAKRNHSQWDCLGQKLYDLAESHKDDPGRYEKELRGLCNLPT